MVHGEAKPRAEPMTPLPPEKLRWRKILYASIFLCFLFSHIDVGILSQANENAKKDL
jgi:hypothetical protein